MVLLKPCCVACVCLCNVCFLSFLIAAHNKRSQTALIRAEEGRHDGLLEEYSTKNRNHKKEIKNDHHHHRHIDVIQMYTLELY